MYDSWLALVAQASQRPRAVFFCGGDGETMGYSNPPAWDALCLKMILAAKQKGCFAFQGKGLDAEFIFHWGDTHYSQAPENEAKFVELYSNVTRLMLCLVPKDRYMPYLDKAWRLAGPVLDKGRKYGRLVLEGIHWETSGEVCHDPDVSSVKAPDVGPT